MVQVQLQVLQCLFPKASKGRIEASKCRDAFSFDSSCGDTKPAPRAVAERSVGRRVSSAAAGIGRKHRCRAERGRKAFLLPKRKRVIALLQVPAKTRFLSKREQDEVRLGFFIAFYFLNLNTAKVF